MNCKRTISAFLALAAGLSMAACTNAGQSASSSSAASSAVSSAAVSNIEAASSSSSASSAPQIKLTLAVSPDTSAPLLGGLYAARKQGYFASYGLDVTITTAKSAAQAVDLASAGTAQFTTTEQSTSFADALIAKKDVTAVAALQQHNDAGVLSLTDKKITRPKQLENTACQTDGTPLAEAMLKEAVTADGGNAALVKTQIASTSGTTAAVKGGALTCGSYSWSGLSCKESGVSASFLFYRDTAPVLDEYPCLLAANNTFLKQHPQTAKDFLSAANLGYLYAAAHPDITAKEVCAQVPAVKNQQALVQRSLTWLAGKYTDDAILWGSLDTQRWNRFYTWMNQKKLSKSSVPLSTGFSSDYLPQPTSSAVS